MTEHSRGSTGETGAQGAAGAQGEAGVTGEPGSQGDMGVTGETGAQGEAGPPGRQGVSGDVGAQGETGTAGRRGQSGRVLSSGRALSLAAFIVFAALVLAVRQEVQGRAIIHNQQRIEKILHDECVVRNEGASRQNALNNSVIEAERRKPAPDAKLISDLVTLKVPLAKCG